MVKRVIKRALFWALACYLVIALGFGFGYVNGRSQDDSTVSVDAVRAGLSWPWLVTQTVADRSG